MEPRLLLNPNSGAPGTVVSVEGCGFNTVFGAEQVIELFWNNSRTLLGTAPIDSNGSFLGTSAATITIPATATSGPNYLTGRAYFDVPGHGLFTVQ